MPPFLPPLVPAAEHGSKKVGGTPSPPVLRVPTATLVNVHTREAVLLDEAPSEAERARIERFLRDRTNWETHPMDRGAVETLRASAVAFGARRVEVVSGYRSDKLNEGLRKKGRHVARHSQHVLGTAIDYRLVGVDALRLHQWVLASHHGGVGFYPVNQFVHVDAGPPRRWRGE